MSRHLRPTAALACTVIALAGLAACGGGGESHHGIPAGSLAAVNGTGITNASVQHWIAVAAISNSVGVLAKGAVAPDPPNYTRCVAHLEEVARTAAPGHKPNPARLKSACEEQYKTLQKRALSFLITSQWEIAEAQALGFSVSDEEVRKQYEQLKSQKYPTAAAFEEYLKRTDQTVADLLFRVKVSLLNAKVQQKIVAGKAASVTQAEIEKYYDAHKSQFGPVETRDVRVILTKEAPEARKAKREIESGKSFAAVAKQASIEAESRASGGLLSEIVKGQHATEFDNAVFSARTGVLGGPVKTVIGYYIYEVLGAKTRSGKTLAAVQASIRAQLASPKEQEAVSKFAAGFKKRWTAQTECRPGYVVEQCKEYKASSAGEG